MTTWAPKLIQEELGWQALWLPTPRTWEGELALSSPELFCVAASVCSPFSTSWTIPVHFSFLSSVLALLAVIFKCPRKCEPMLPLWLSVFACISHIQTCVLTFSILQWYFTLTVHPPHGKCHDSVFICCKENACGKSIHPSLPFLLSFWALFFFVLKCITNIMLKICHTVIETLNGRTPRKFAETLFTISDSQVLVMKTLLILCCYLYLLLYGK